MTKIAFAVMATFFLAGVAHTQSARDYVWIIGSSNVYLFSIEVAEQFVQNSKFKAKTPKVESTGTSDGFNLFCNGIGVQYPDIVSTLSKIKKSDIEICAKRGVNQIIEVKIGFEGIVIEENIDKIQNETVAETFEIIEDGKYPISRPLFVYIKKAHVGVIPGIREFIAEFTSENAVGNQGYLSKKGLIPIANAKPKKVEAQKNNLSTQQLIVHIREVKEIRKSLISKIENIQYSESQKQICDFHKKSRQTNSIFTILNIYSRFEPPLIINFESTLYLADAYLAWSISADLWLGMLNDEWPKPNWPISYCENLDSTFSIQQPEDSKIKVFSSWLKELADRSSKSDYASILKDQMPEQWSSILLEYADLQREAKQRLEMLDKIYNSSKSDPNSDVEAVDALRRYTNTLRLLQQAQDKALRTYLFDAVLLPYIDWREQQIRNDPKNTIEYAAEFSKLTEFTQYAVDPTVQRKAFEVTRLIKEKIGEEAYKEAVARAKMTPDWYRTVQELGKP